MRMGFVSAGSMPIGQGIRGLKFWQLLALIVAWLATMGVGYAAYERATTPAAAAPKGQVVAVQRGTIAATVSATGSVVATSSSKLSFKSSGRLAELLVQVGDSVKAGQPLARIEQTDLQLQVTQSQAQLSSAQAKLAQIQQGSRKDEIVAAQSSLTSAKAKLALLQSGPTDADMQAAQSAVASAKSSLVDAQTKLATLQAQPNPDDVKAAQIQLDKAQQSLVAAQIDRNGVCGRDDKASACYAGDAQVGQAQTAISTAAENLKTVSKPATADDLNAAQQAVSSAQVAYDSSVAKLQQVKAGATAADISAATSAVEAATSQVALKQVPYTAADVQGAQSAVDQAKASLALAQYQLANATMVAPFAGNIAAISVNPGEMVAAGAITLVDPKAVRIDTTVDESEIAKLELGQRADITFDALSGRSYSGKVIAISPSGTVQSGVVTYLVSLSVDDPTGLKPGMTANANVVYSQKDNAVMVPNRAVRAQGRNRVVDVETDTGTVVRPVQVGISNDQYTEITDGLSDGDQVLVPTTSVSAPQVRGGGFPGVGGGGVRVVGRPD